MNVARLAGMPVDIIRRAAEVASEAEEQHLKLLEARAAEAAAAL